MTTAITNNSFSLITLTMSCLIWRKWVFQQLHVRLIVMNNEIIYKYTYRLSLINVNSLPAPSLLEIFCRCNVQLISCYIFIKSHFNIASDGHFIRRKIFLKNTDFQLQKLVQNKPIESESLDGDFCILKCFSRESDALQSLELSQGWEVTKKI